MGKLSAWINAARPRTLPLSISGILIGTALAGYLGYGNTTLFWLAIFTTIGFQITSNFANDYGDGVKGTDNHNRVGPKRALQSGLLSRTILKRGIIVSVLINILLVIALIYTAFGKENLVLSLTFLLLGALSIWAAIKYTVGDKAYGYKGLGDVFVFVFFGLVSVLGSLFLYTSSFYLLGLLPATSIGLLSVGVLNLNNLRDFNSDKESGKNTVIVKIGFEAGKKYHHVLLFGSFISLALFIFLTYKHWSQLLCLLSFVPIVLHAFKVKNTAIPKNLDPELKKLALSAFAMALLFYLGYNYFL